MHLKNPKVMKKILLISAMLLLVTWAVLFFIFKTGEMVHVLLAIAGILVLLRYSIRHVVA